jgi:hypothetical protein
VKSRIQFRIQVKSRKSKAGNQKQDPDLDPNLSEKQGAMEAKNEAEEGHSGAMEAVFWSRKYFFLLRNNEAADPHFDSGSGPG